MFSRLLFSISDKGLVTNIITGSVCVWGGGGGGCRLQKGRGHVKFYPYEKVGGGGVLAMLNGVG